MTNSEYFEENKISFAEAMEIFNKQKAKGTKSFDKFLASEHAEYKFKAGDLIVLQLNDETRSRGWSHNVVFKIIERVYHDYEVEYMTPGDTAPVGYVRILPIHFVENYCVLY